MSHRSRASQVARLGAALRQREMRIATAESCTGGWIGKVLTDQAGSSGWYVGGVIVYSNALKAQLLDVPSALIGRFGAVSREVAVAMALGARKLGADLTLATTGIAGPGGGSEEKPAGTVWFGAALGSRTHATCHLFAGDRWAVREQSVDACLVLALHLLAAHR